MEINFQDLAEKIKSSSLPILVEFWGSWCLPCQSSTAILAELAQEYQNNLAVFKINADRNPLVAQHYEILGLPSFILFAGGKEVGRRVGAQTKAELKKMLAEFLAIDQKKQAKKVVAIIPARGESRHFPGKNLALLAGRPLISYAVETAKKSKYLDRVIISTENQEIAEAAQKWGGEVPFLRPEELAKEGSLVIDAIKYTLGKMESDGNYQIDYVVLLQPTSPLVKTEQIDKAIELALAKEADSVVALAPVSNIDHPFNIREITADGQVHFWQEKLHYDYLDKPRPQLYNVANLWVASRQTIMEKRRLEGEKNYPLLVDLVSSLNIYHKEDLELVEAWLEYRNKK